MCTSGPSMLSLFSGAQGMRCTLESARHSGLTGPDTLHALLRRGNRGGKVLPVL
jgi:hypothetical protein